MKLKLLKRESVAKDTVSFFFEPQETVERKPGQYFYINVPELKYPDPRGPKRQFTISSSPTEGPIMMVTVRTRAENISGYKRTLYELPDGTLLDGEGPQGHYILDETTPIIGEHVFIAGGIGITPYRCFMKYAIDKGLTTPMHLIYANSTPDEITFKDELESWARDHANIKVDMTISHPEEAQVPWTGLTGRVDVALVEKLVPNFKAENTTLWMCGPPPMVDAIDEALGKAGIPSQRRKIEKFTGY
jgi:glycine betaine catabolism B